MGRALSGLVGGLFGGGSSRPTVLAPPPPPPPAPVAEPEPAPPIPTKDDAEVRKTSDAERKRAAAAFGRGATILTGPQGLSTSPNSAKKTLLGS